MAMTPKEALIRCIEHHTISHDEWQYVPSYDCCTYDGIASSRGDR